MATQAKARSRSQKKVYIYTDTNGTRRPGRCVKKSSKATNASEEVRLGTQDTRGVVARSRRIEARSIIAKICSRSRFCKFTLPRVKKMRTV